MITKEPANKDPVQVLLEAGHILIKMAEGIADVKPGQFFGVDVKPGQWRDVMLPIYEAQQAANEAKPAPFGRYGDGTPKMAPAFDSCRVMWEAAQREGLFNVHKYIGQGIQQGAAQMYTDVTIDMQGLEDEIVALGMSEWGQAWIKHVENACLLPKEYQIKFAGFYVTRDFDGTYVHFAANGQMIS